MSKTKKTDYVETPAGAEYVVAWMLAQVTEAAKYLPFQRAQQK